MWKCNDKFWDGDIYQYKDIDVSRNRDIPKWMVKIMENPKIDDLGVPLFLETHPYIYMYMCK